MYIGIRVPNQTSAGDRAKIESELREQLAQRFSDEKAKINCAEIDVRGAGIKQIEISVSDMPGGNEGFDIVLKSTVFLLRNEFEGTLREIGTDYSMRFKPFVPA